MKPKVFFDVDGTLMHTRAKIRNKGKKNYSCSIERRLRPGTVNLFAALKMGGVGAHIWSSQGVKNSGHATKLIRKYDNRLVSDYHCKGEMKKNMRGTIVVDDDYGFLTKAAKRGAYPVHIPSWSGRKDDKQMQKVGVKIINLLFD